MRKLSTTDGFSLVETLVAITILLIVIVGPLSISSQTAKSTSFSSEQVQAFFLAQEGAELIEKARDDLALRHLLPTGDALYLANPWTIFINTTGLYRECYEPEGCGTEINSNNAGSLRTPIDCGTLGLCRLHLSTANTRSRYTHTSAGNTQTLFTRKIYLTRVSADEVQVNSEVTWRTGSLRDEQKVRVETYLFNIYE